MDNLHWKSASEIASLIRRRKISAVEVLEHFLTRVDRFNPHLNAIVWQDREAARKKALAADASLAAGRAWGPLHGVPMTIKESYDVAGAPTTWGDPEFRTNIAEESALAVKRLEAAGVILFGKTNVPLMLADWQSYNAIYGITVNPWNPALTPGGSSGGSAAALAAGLTGLEAGSDIGASIRNPAHFCGVFGLKPTWGLVSPKGHNLPGIVANSDIAAIGPLARSADDLEAALDAMAGPDEIDSAAWTVHLPACPAQSLKDMRIAVKLTDPNCEIDTAYADRLQTLVDALAKRGATIKEVEPPIDTTRMHDVYVWLLRAATSGRTPHADIERWKENAVDPAIGNARYLNQMIKGNTLGHREWLALNNERLRLRQIFNSFFADWDVVFCPAASSAAWPHDHQGERWTRTIPINGKRQPTTDQMFWAGYPGTVYLPAVVGPAGLTHDGLPVGYQAIAASGRDKTAIAFSRFVEREIGGFIPPGGY